MESEKVNEISVVDAIRYIKERSKRIQHTARGIPIAFFDGFSLIPTLRSLTYVFLLLIVLTPRLEELEQKETIKNMMSPRQSWDSGYSYQCTYAY